MGNNAVQNNSASCKEARQTVSDSEPEILERMNAAKTLLFNSYISSLTPHQERGH